MSDLVQVDSLPIGRRECLRVALDRHQGVPVIDLRVTVDLTEAARVQTPTKKGVTVSVEHLPAIIAALQSAHQRAHDLGWTGAPQ